MTNALITAQFTASFSSVGVSDGSAYIQWGNSQSFQFTGLTSIGNIPAEPVASTRYGGVTSLSSIAISFPAIVSVGDQFSYPSVGSTLFVTYITPFGSGGGSVMRETPLRVT